MHRPLLFLALASSLGAEHLLYTCGVNSRAWVVGAQLAPSGVFVRAPSGEWRRLGYNHPYIAAFDFDPLNPSTLFLAAGNGLIRAASGGSEWTILTGHDVTELRDLSLDRNSPGAIYFAHTAGIRATRDGGRTWEELAGAMRQQYTESVRADRARAGRVVAGTVDGLWLSEDGGRGWRRAGAPGVSIMHIEQSPHDPCQWLAVSERAGVFASSDCARTFESSGALGVGRNLYDVAFDPSSTQRIAIAGWGPGVAVSENAGKTWTLRNRGLPAPDVWSIAFDPGRPGRLYASVHEEAVYVSDDAGLAWRKDGLEGSIVHRMRFIPQVAPR